MSKPSEFDKRWDSFMKEIKDAGLDQLTVTFNKLLAGRIKLWND